MNFIKIKTTVEYFILPSTNIISSKIQNLKRNGLNFAIWKRSQRGRTPTLNPNAKFIKLLNFEKHQNPPKMIKLLCVHSYSRCTVSLRQHFCNRNTMKWSPMQEVQVRTITMMNHLCWKVIYLVACPCVGVKADGSAVGLGGPGLGVCSFFSFFLWFQGRVGV